ncbi:MAG: response regulator [Gammaproteobacteria bacterium]|nr:response regulator [Gammaproteobacteria bacterium]
MSHFMQYQDNSSSKSRVLIVDNDPVMRLLMRESLAQDSYIIEEAADGYEALKAIAQQPPDVVLLDVRMPEMNGYEVCAEIRKNHDDSGIAIIMVTGLDDSDSIAKAFRLGGTDFINKPINWSVFPYRVQYVLRAKTAFSKLKRREKHLAHLERISQLITQHSNRDLILQNALEIMLDIFTADRACIIAFSDNSSARTNIPYEALLNDTPSLHGYEDQLWLEIKHKSDIINDGSPAALNSNTVNLQQGGQYLFSAFAQMLVPLYRGKKQSYFLCLHQCSIAPAWSTDDRETFKSIAERLSGIFSQHLLTRNLSQSEDLLRQAQHIGQLGNWTLNLATDRMNWSNEVFKLFNKSPSSFIPSFSYFSNIVYKKDMKLLKSFHQSILHSGGTHSIEFRFLTSEGMLRYAYLQGTGIGNEKGEVIEIAGTIKDITEQKITTLALLESEARFRRLAENAPGVIFRVSLPDEKFEYISPASINIFDYRPDEFKDVDWLFENVINSENKPHFFAQWQAFKQGKNNNGFEYSIRKKSGETRWLNQNNVLIRDADGTVIAAEGIITDITPQKIMHEKLLDSESDMRGILSNLQDTFFRINKFGRVTMSSDSVTELLKLSPLELNGKKFSDLFINFDEYATFISALAENDGHLVSYHARMRRQDDEIRWVALSMQTSESSSNFIEGTARDITDILKQQEQDAHDQKMEAIGKLTSGVAHDFGNLMTIAKGNLELFEDLYADHYDSKSDARELLEDTRSAIADSISLTRQLLAFSRGKAVTPQIVNAGETIIAFAQLIRSTLGDCIKLSIDIQNELPPIKVDPAQFESALLNVMINARDAMPNGGEASIIATSTRDPNSDDEYVLITLEDNGTGMNSEVLKHAIEPFYTTKKNEGNGLGLSMVYGFMQQSNGELNIHSSPGLGTSLSMKFPAQPAQAAEKIELSDHEDAPFNCETILVVEDRDAVRRFVLRSLSQLNLNIIDTDNVEHAQDILNNNPNISLLFSDIVMPGNMDGCELAVWAHKRFPDLKILLTTAAEMEAQIESCCARQLFPILQKPYNQHDLINKLRDLL